MLKFYLLFLFIFLIYLGIEYARLARALKKIPLRILVNGTRGKSTLVKIIYKMLLQNGQKVFAKTTGDQPLEHLPEGHIKAITRNAPPSIIENIRILRRWSKESPEAVVLECMALHPETQRVLSRHILKPNYILITNIYPDHAEAMGPRIEDMISTIYECTHERAHIIATEQLAKDLPCYGNSSKEFIVVKPEAFPEKFDYIPSQIVNESWSLTKTLAYELNIHSRIAYRCFREVYLSMNKKLLIAIPDLNWSFWNLFSVNDHESAVMFMKHGRRNQDPETQEILLLNTRSDRPLRTGYFVNLILQEFQNAAIWLTGSGQHLARNLLIRQKLNHKLITLISPKELLQKLTRGFTLPSIIFGVGNFYGMQETVKQIWEVASQNK